MSQEKVLKTLESLGLAKLDAQVYVFLGKKGPQKARDLAKALKIRKQRLYVVLKNLESRGLVDSTLEYPARFSALPFEKALDLFVKAKMEEAQRIESGKEELFSDWQSISVAEVADQSPKFSVIEGRNFIYPRLKQMIEETRNQLLIISTVSGLVRADQFGLIEAAFNHARRTNTRFRFITELTAENLKPIKLLLERMPRGSGFEGRTPELGQKLVSRMLIRDDAEAAFFVSQGEERTGKGVDDVCLWTNSDTIVSSFAAVFEDLWKNSADIEKRIAEIETGRPAAKTCVINEPEAAKKRYNDTVDAAQTEIVMVTSSEGLIETWKNIIRLNKLAERGVSIKIMASIVRDNLKAALQLSKFCRVRHVPASYLETTVVDGQHLFQFKPTLSSIEKGKKTSGFENTFYSNDPEYLDKTKSMLEEVWRHAVAPSAVTVEEITKPSMPSVAPVPDDEYTASRKDGPYQKMVIGIDEKQGSVTEEHILNKIINAKRILVKDPWKDPAVYFGSVAGAVIHPPSSFNLPDMLMTFFHLNKQSAWGAEDYFVVYLWLETPRGKAFVPVALVGDSHKGMQHRRLTYGGTPAGQNFHVLRKDELQIQVHGNTFFAGWTVPIPLFPPQYTLPPATVLFEGYGRFKPGVLTVTMPSGWTPVMESNGLEAFVTFFHPASKYAGPGTDGTLGRDVTYTVYPPSVPQPKT